MPAIMYNDENVTVVLVTTGPSSALANGHSMLVVTVTLTSPQLSVKLRPRVTPCTVVRARLSVRMSFTSELCTSAILVDRMVMLALALTVKLMLVWVRVGVLPTLLLITVIAQFRDRSPVTLLVPCLGCMLVTIRCLLTLIRSVTVCVAAGPLFASTMVLMLCPWSSLTVRCELVPGMLVMVMTLVRRLLTVVRTGAPFRRDRSLTLVTTVLRPALRTALEVTLEALDATLGTLMLRLLTRLAPLMVMARGRLWKAMCVAMLWLVTVRKLAARVSLVMLVMLVPLVVVVMTVVVSGRLELCLVVVITASKLLGC